MWQITEDYLLQQVSQYLWPFFRIGGFFMAMPIIGTRVVSMRVRVLLAFMITLLVAPLIPAVPAVDGLTLGSFLIAVQQVLIGLAMGFILQVVMQVFVLAGQFIAMKMGLGFASMNDPANGVMVTVVSQYYLILATLLFISMNAHLVAIEAIIESFISLPVSSTGLSASHYWEIARLGSWMFSRALMIALPLFTSLLIVNLAFGVMSRAAPQMNIFAVGFPITLVFGLVLMWFGLEALLPNYLMFLNEGLSFLHNLPGNP